MLSAPGKFDIRVVMGAVGNNLIPEQRVSWMPNRAIVVHGAHAIDNENGRRSTRPAGQPLLPYAHSSVSTGFTDRSTTSNW